MLLSDIFLFVFQRTSPIIWGLMQLKSPFNSLSKQSTPPPPSTGVKLKKKKKKKKRVSINIY